MSDADGWIEWQGGECPVAWNTKIVARLRYRVVDAAPETDAGRQHVSDAAYAVYAKLGGVHSSDQMESLHKRCGTVLLTVAEHDELLALRAEVERLKQANDEVAGQVEFLDRLNSVLLRDNKRLRKGRDDAPACQGSHVVGETYSDCPRHPASAALVVVADTLDARLGLPQPDGEPCEPMSGRKPYRWGAM